MARGKYEAKKPGTSSPSAEVSGGVGSPVATAVSSAPAPAVPSSRRAGDRPDVPALGIAVMSQWGWRILAVFAMVAFGLCITFFLDGHTVFGALWVVVALGWGGFSFRLWRLHLDWDAA
jgi:hypothetical protein